MIASMSQIHLAPDMAALVFVLDPQGEDRSSDLD